MIKYGIMSTAVVKTATTVVNPGYAFRFSCDQPRRYWPVLVTIAGKEGYAVRYENAAAGVIGPTNSDGIDPQERVFLMANLILAQGQSSNKPEIKRVDLFAAL